MTYKKVQCVVCGKEYEIELKRYNAKNKEGSAFYCSKDCYHHKGSVQCNCANCGKEIWKTKSQLARSKTGNVYCSRSCATSKNNTLFKTGENHPNYVGNDYRQKALYAYEHKCAICGYNEDQRILEVHHKDENRSNNELSNLIILCPNCHRKITLHYYELSNDLTLVPIK